MTPQEAIAATVAAWGDGNPAALIRIAERESRLTPTAKGDAGSAPESYEREQDALRKMGNPWANDASKWDHSIGLYQMMPANHARLWDPRADPDVLFDPRIATVVAARLWNRGVARGADDFVRMRLWWGAPKYLNVPSSDEQYQKRLNKWSIVEGVLNPRTDYFDYSAFGTGPQEGQQARLPGAAVELPAPTNWLKIISYSWLAYKLWKKYGAH
jgi:hypothetical protein